MGYAVSITTLSIYSIDLDTGDETLLFSGSSTVRTRTTLAVTADRIFVGDTRNLFIFDHSGNRQTAEENTLENVIPTQYLTANGSTIFGSASATSSNAEAANRDYSNADDKDITFEQPHYQEGLAASNTRLYRLLPRHFQLGLPPDRVMVQVYNLGELINFEQFVAYQFDTVDNNTFYFLSTNNTQGDALNQSAFSRVKVHKYVKDTDTWLEVLNATTGQPQLAHAYKLDGQVVYRADNRKNFAVILHNSKLLIFYRRVQELYSGIAYYNETDGTLTDIYSENHGSQDHYGLPYSMDFALDIRRDGIYVYTFVVRHTLDTSGNFTTGTLKIFRKRVEPSGTQTEILFRNLHRYKHR